MTLDLWKVALAPHRDAKKLDIRTLNDALKANLEVTDATVPGCIEEELIKRKLLPEDLFFGTNVLEVQKYEFTHMYYFTEFVLEEKEDTDAFLLFEGIDTFADVYIDGELFAQTEDMLIPHEFSLDGISAGKHELSVHITPALVRASTLTIPPRARSMKYNSDSLGVRKAPYMYGWDIMPRTVSAGLWKNVSVVYRPATRIDDAYIFTSALFSKKNDFFGGKCELQCILKITPGDISPLNLTAEISGECKGQTFEGEFPLYSSTSRLHIRVPEPLLWWPKNYGEPNLYKTSVKLKYNGKVIDEKTINVGIRTIELERTSLAGDDGKFNFTVNGKKIVALGTNWVPTHPFPYRHAEYTLRGLELVNDLNCNMIRCWGGNIYPDKEFYDYCDEHGILVWQDFAMGCATYPNDEHFCSLMQKEAEQVITMRRNHPSLAIWAGDNECDSGWLWSKVYTDNSMLCVTDPNKNKVTRNILADAVYWFDATRPYLPSSPYIDEVAFKTGKLTSEIHRWDQKTFFKAPFFKEEAVCHFQSEIGYLGCPSPESVRKFISEDTIKDFTSPLPEWVVHCSQPSPDTSGPYAYRCSARVMQAEHIFGSVKEMCFEDFAMCSQISHAEAFKFFIERMRAGRGHKWGILWWNIIDGWPQFADAVVDWYGEKKLAYSYIKRSQKPFCFICDEADADGMISLLAVNDSREEKNVHFTVTALKSGKCVAEGTVLAKSDSNVIAARFKETEGEYYAVTWDGDDCGKNHFVANIGNGVTLDEYTRYLADFK